MNTAQFRRINRVGDEFEAACLAGERPVVEKYLGCVPDEDQLALLVHLRRLEADYRRKDSPTGRERYALIREVGGGGMGVVSLQRDKELGRDVALKELRPDRVDNPEILRSFLREAQITSRFGHPNIVQVYDLVRPADGQPFYTMRFVKGRKLAAAIQEYHHKRRAGQATPLELLTLLNALVSVCNAVAYAHSQDIIHRDLKGDNIVLGDFGEVIVLDWGLAKLLDAPSVESGASNTITDTEDRHDQTRQGSLKGTPVYMAPEQAAGDVERIGPRTDVYGLGAILYEILTGRPPFTAPDLLELLRWIQQDPPEPPRRLVPEVPAELEAACLRALAKAPADRHASAAELAGDVQRWLAESAERSRAAQERERFFELSFDMLCTIGPDHRFEQVNRAWEATLGWTRDELMVRPYTEFVHPEDRAATLATGARVIAGDVTPAFENRYLCNDGSHRWVSWMANLIPGEQLIYAVGRDVTERKRAEEALRRSQERFELAVRGSGDGLWDWDIEANVSYYSPRWKAMLGYEDHELTHDLEVWARLVHRDDYTRVRAALDACVQGETEAYECVYRMQHKDGRWLCILDRGIALRDAQGKAYRMAGSHTDMTGRNSAE